MQIDILAPLVDLFSGVPAWQATALLVGFSVGMAVLFEFVILRGLIRFTSRTETQYDNIIVSELRLPLVLTVALTGIYLLTQIPSVASTVVVSSDQLQTFFGRPSLSVILLAWAFAANRVVNRLVEALKDEGSRFDFAPVLSNVWTLLVVLGTIAMLLSIWEYSIAPLLGAAGVAGIAVGFAARDTVANFFGGIALYFDDTYKLGDYIELASGEAGTVVSVGIRSTTILTRDEIMVVLPNAALNSGKVINQSAPQRRRRVKIPIGVAYGTDIDEFETLVTEIAGEEPLVLDSPKPRMRFRGFGDSALQYELLGWVSSPTRSAKAQHKLNRQIYKQTREAGIEIPFPQRELSVKTDGVSPSDMASDTAPEAVNEALSEAQTDSK